MNGNSCKSTRLKISKRKNCSNAIFIEIVLLIHTVIIVFLCYSFLELKILRMRAMKEAFPFHFASILQLANFYQTMSLS